MDINKFVEKLIDRILDDAEEKNVAFDWGEETIRVDYIINLINDLADMDYKRPWHKNKKCSLCKKYYYRNKKSDHRKNCIGKPNGCDDLDAVYDFI